MLSKLAETKHEFEFYTRQNGHNEFIEFLETLPLKDQAKRISIINRVQEKELTISSRMKWIKKIDSDVFEIRSKASSIIQRALYFHVSGNRYVINHGFTKKTQNTPASEIDHAKMLKKNSTRIINMAAIILMII